MRSFAAAMALLFALIMVYGWQHFSAIEYGYRIESEKQQIDPLNEQNRQLRLTEAQLGDPVRIDTIARQLGLRSAPGTGGAAGDAADPSAPVLAQASPFCRTHMAAAASERLGEVSLP